MANLKIIRSTYLKTSNEESYTLPDGNKFWVDEDYELVVTKTAYDNKHIIFYVSDPIYLPSGKLLQTDVAYFVYDGSAELSGAKDNRSGDLVERIYNCCVDRGYPSDIRPGAINLFGVQGLNLDGTKNNKQSGEWNDLIGAFSLSPTSKVPRLLCVFTGNTEPGRYYADTKPQRSGLTRMAYGFHDRIWSVGLHRSRYEALVQNGYPVKIYRDFDKNYMTDGKDLPYTGYFGMNLHGGSKSKNSPGCQVIQSMENFKILMNVVKSSLQYKNGELFSYVLLLGRWL